MQRKLALERAADNRAMINGIEEEKRKRKELLELQVEQANSAACRGIFGAPPVFARGTLPSRLQNVMRSWPEASTPE